MAEARVLEGPIVHLPGRRFPGVVVQGDTLNALISNLCEASNCDDAAERSYLLAELIEQLKGVQVLYEAALAREGMALPYPKVGDS